MRYFKIVCRIIFFSIILLFVFTIFDKTYAYSLLGDATVISTKQYSINSLTTNSNTKLNLTDKYSPYDIKKQKNVEFNQVQSFCTDGTYFYIACLTPKYEPKTNAEKNNHVEYIYQTTAIIKMGINDGKIYGSANLGKIGHSNSMTYNSNTGKILIATCSNNDNLKGIIYSLNASDINNNNRSVNLTKITLSKKCAVTSIAYDTGRDLYYIKESNKVIGIYKQKNNTSLERTGEIKPEKVLIYDNTIVNGKSNVGQSIYCDNAFIYSVYQDKNGKSYILVFNYEGKLARNMSIKRI